MPTTTTKAGFIELRRSVRGSTLSASREEFTEGDVVELQRIMRKRAEEETAGEQVFRLAMRGRVAALLGVPNGDIKFGPDAKGVGVYSSLRGVFMFLNTTPGYGGETGCRLWRASVADGGRAEDGGEMVIWNAKCSDMVETLAVMMDSGSA